MEQSLGSEVEGVQKGGDAGVVVGKKRLNYDSSDFYDDHDSFVGEEKSIKSNESRKS